MSRRAVMVRAAVALAAAATMLAGCATAAVTEAGGSQLLATAEGITQYPLTIATQFGDTVLDERPERIVAITPSGEDAILMLALGAIPVAAGPLVDEHVYVENPGPAEIAHRLEAGAWGEQPAYDDIARLEPDAIVALRVEPGGGTMDAETFERLSAIAPVVTDTTPAGTVPDWRDSLAVLGEALDLTRAAQQLESTFDEQFALYRDDHPAFVGATVTLGILYDQGPEVVNSPGTGAETFFAELGFAPNPKLAELAELAELAGTSYVSAELTPLLDAEALVLASFDDELRTAYAASEHYRALPVVQRGAVVELDFTAGVEQRLGWALGYGGPAGRQWAAELLVPRLSEVLQT